ncbi:Mrp/NBP35 family ATP-binding protein [Candidatus Tokpelaia sp.]|uniref:Mrp/NBP35 family ATP-binding protein n=1 Tax=Candidatus Tokpelaia sp. TaxID=2233777 RepID=UPI00123A52EA|nr:Mrp/NBP35 family ATP-binding protein [Candidatus Tokpelaia sp.]KAA6405180.1 sodium:proton antiporter [Candidatus Tokpelaia sp.]
MAADLRGAVLDRLKTIYPPAPAKTVPAPGRTSGSGEKQGKGDIVSGGLVSDIFIADGQVFFAITVPADKAALWENTRRQAAAEVEKLAGVNRVFASLTAEKKPAAAGTRPHEESRSGFAARPAHKRPAPKVPGQPAAVKQPLPGVRHIIAVASGKGGVGKSTIAVNLAAALQANGLKTGLLDADIYGPSLPRLTGLLKPQGEDIVHFHDKKLIPLQHYGLKLMSMGFLVEAEAPLVWRGPMVMAAVNQLLHDVLWAPLDILVVDMPPGTGDAQLTLAQKVPLAGAVIVSTPQELALSDARKGLAMFAKIHVPILGIIENMSCFIAPDTGQSYHIFGTPDALGRGGAEQEAARRNVPFLGALPLDPELGRTAERGVPLVISHKTHKLTQIYRRIAANIMRQLHLPLPAEGA